MCQDCIVEHIEAFIATARNQIIEQKLLSAVLGAVKPCVPYNLRADLSRTTLIVRFPAPRLAESRRAAIFIRLLGLVVSNLNESKVVTSRDIYYQDVGLFRNQNTVVRAVEHLTRVLQVPRDALNIVPSPNGLVAGDLTIVLDDGQVLEVVRSNGASLIPVAKILHVRSIYVPQFILVVEKEAVFSHLLNELIEGVVVTGRGFPDHATRRLVKALTRNYPHIPVFCLVDSDVHGVLIMRTYEFGSQRSIEPQEVIPNLHFLGVSLIEYEEGLVSSTIRDKHLAMSTLKKDWINAPIYASWKTELQRGLFMGKKGEMNLLDREQSSRLSSYVRGKIARYNAVRFNA